MFIYMRPSSFLRKWWLPLLLHDMEPVKTINKTNKLPERNICMFVSLFIYIPTHIYSSATTIRICILYTYTMSLSHLQIQNINNRSSAENKMF